jgi:hypothetical protein
LARAQSPTRLDVHSQLGSHTSASRARSQHAYEDRHLPRAQHRPAQQAGRSRSREQSHCTTRSRSRGGSSGSLCERNSARTNGHWDPFRTWRRNTGSSRSGARHSAATSCRPNRSHPAALTNDSSHLALRQNLSTRRTPESNTDSGVLHLSARRASCFTSSYCVWLCVRKRFVALAQQLARLGSICGGAVATRVVANQYDLACMKSVCGRRDSFAQRNQRQLGRRL